MGWMRPESLKAKILNCQLLQLPHIRFAMIRKPALLPVATIIYLSQCTVTNSLLKFLIVWLIDHSSSVKSKRSEVGSWRSEVRCQKSLVSGARRDNERSQKSLVSGARRDNERSQKSEGRSRKSEVGGRKSACRSRKSDVRSRLSRELEEITREVGGRKSEVGGRMGKVYHCLNQVKPAFGFRMQVFRIS